jgi:acyl carrier protein
MKNDPLTFDGFCALLSTELGVSPERLSPEAAFIDDLRIDSIRMIEMVLRLEDLGAKIPAEEAWNIRTVQDAYDYYRRYACQVS